MKLAELKLPGVYLVEPEKHVDERGFFARTWCVREFEKIGIQLSLVQASVSFTRACGSLRGMHYQRPPSIESKLVRCTKGKIFDVIVDIRPASVTFLEYVGVELSADNHRAMFIPSGFAHGFQTMTDDVEIFYEMTDFYQPEFAGGFRWDDESVQVAWPLPVTMLNERDAGYASLQSDDFECFRDVGGGIPVRTE